MHQQPRPLSIVLACLVGCGASTGGATNPRGGGDAAPTGGATCATPGLMFCDDFESTPLGTVSSASSTAWTFETQGGSLAIDAGHAQGARALHVHTDGNGRAMIRPVAFSPPDNSFYGRARIWITAFPTAPDYAHFTLVEAAGQSGGGVVRPIGGQYIPLSGDPAAGRSLWGVGSDGGPTGDWTRWRTAAPAEAGRWLCMEWQLSAGDDSVHVWIDGAARPELTVSKTDHGGASVDFVFPAFTQIWFGWWLYQGGPSPGSFDLWYDDIALGSSRIGC